MRAGLACALLATTLPAAAYFGAFEPMRPDQRPIHVRVEIVDSSTPGVECAQRGGRSSALVASACAITEADRCVIVLSLTGVASAVQTVNTFASPNAILGHELRHCFEGAWHP